MTAMAHAPDLPLEASPASPTGWRSAIARVNTILGFAVALPAAGLVIAEILVLLAGIVARYAFHAPIIWSDELAGTSSCGLQCSARSSPSSATSTCG